MKNEISHFKEKPQTKIGWWTMGLGLATVVIGPMLGIFTALLRQIVDKESVTSQNFALGFTGGLFGLILAVATYVSFARAFKKGERSWVLWVGLVPAVLIGAFWIFMIIGEFIFPH